MFIVKNMSNAALRAWAEFHHACEPGMRVIGRKDLRGALARCYSLELMDWFVHNALNDGLLKWDRDTQGAYRDTMFALFSQQIKGQQAASNWFNDITTPFRTAFRAANEAALKARTEAQRELNRLEAEKVISPAEWQARNGEQSTRYYEGMIQRRNQYQKDMEPFGKRYALRLARVDSKLVRILRAQVTVED